jgi:hypothetical protein
VRTKLKYSNGLERVKNRKKKVSANREDPEKNSCSPNKGPGAEAYVDELIEKEK